MYMIAGIWCSWAAIMSFYDEAYIEGGFEFLGCIAMCHDAVAVFFLKKK